jgi:hypothetical protein
VDDDAGGVDQRRQRGREERFEPNGRVTQGVLLARASSLVASPGWPANNAWRRVDRLAQRGDDQVMAVAS